MKTLTANRKELFETQTPILNTGTAEEMRQRILTYFHQTFDIDEHLFEVFADESAMYKRADPLRHPLIFYFGHTAVFFINKLILSKIIDNRINPKFESMFAVGVDEMSWDDLDMNHYDWPPVNEVRTYRKLVRERVDQVIRELPLNLPINWKSPFWVIMMGIEHARIHLETSSVLIRQLPLKYLQPIEGWNLCDENGQAPANTLLPVEGGRVKIGKEREHPLYGWDNEYGQHEVDLKPFKASKYLCSNGEFLEFVEMGGYREEKYWTEEGWSWKSYKEAEHPLFWQKDGNNWKLRLVYNEIDMPWSWPVEVNYLEAKAFCNWKSEVTGRTIRLATEEEWYRIHDLAQIPDQPLWKKAPGNINMEHFQSPCPVNQFAFGDFYDIIGNVWQWTETPITGFGGFKVHPFYDDFSTPTFDRQHNLIKGGSWISTGNEATRDARYAFRRHFYQHAGFRYVESENPVIIQRDVYETDPEVVRYCHAQYSSDLHGFPNYHQEIAEKCIERMQGKKGRALDLGCKTGRSTWELARAFDQVTGLDFTARNIRLAIELQENGNMQYIFPNEGELVSYHQVNLKDLNMEALTGKVSFYQADASNLKDLYAGYDLILLNDILDEMYNPCKFLNQAHTRLNAGGMLVIASSYSWGEEQTEKKNWVGGYREDGEPVRTRDALSQLLSEHFEQIDEDVHLASVLPYSKRKYEVKDIEISFWKKRL